VTNVNRRPKPSDRIRAWLRRARALIRRTASDRGMSAELAFHLDMETDKNIRAGMDPADARRAAVLAFGGMDRVSEEIRDVRRIAWLDDGVRDLRHAARTFRRSPAFAVSAVAALSLGIGANTAVFAVVHAVVIAPLPYAEPERLVRVWEANPGQRIEHALVSPGTLVDLRQRSRTLERVAIFGERNMLFADDRQTWAARAAAVSPALFDVLSVRPVAGRVFSSEDPRTAWTGSDNDVVISYGLWQRQFGGDPAVIGRTIRMDYRWSYTIIGVMPLGFSFPTHTDVWVPLTYGPTVSPIERQFRYYGAVAQVRQGVTIDEARRETAEIAAKLQTELPASNAGWTIELAPLDRSIVGSARPALFVLLGLATCVLLIACGNVATLAVARATARRHELAVRTALGAGRGRLIRQWGTEALLLAGLGGVGGAFVGYWCNRLLLSLAPHDIPRLDEVRFGSSAVAFVGLATIVVGLIVGLVPALRSRDASALDALRSRTLTGGVRSARSREWLVGTQVALTCVLTVAAVLLLRSFERLQATDLGFRRESLLSAELRVPAGRFSEEQPWFQRVEYYDRLIAELSRLPGVRAVGGTSAVPLTGEVGSGSMWRTDAPGAHGVTPPTSAADQWKAAIQLVTPRYFEVLGVPILHGRAFAPTDRFTEQALTNGDLPRPPGVAIINETMARRYWPGADPLGSTIFLFDDKSFAAYRTVVGVVGDVRSASVDSTAVPTVYLPFAQNPGQGLSLLLRSDVSLSGLVAPVVSRLRAFDPAINIANVRPFADVFDGALSRPRFTTLLAGGFATLALVIAAVGVFGIVGFLVARRTQELGIRVALGARRGDVLWLVLAEGLRPVVLGIVVGSVAAAAVARAMRALLYGISPLDSASFAMAAAILVGTSALASVIPAARAVGVDPLRSLRSD
jgi:putative ABC transport system permease protein